MLKRSLVIIGPFLILPFSHKQCPKLYINHSTNAAEDKNTQVFTEKTGREKTVCILRFYVWPGSDADGFSLLSLN